MNKYAEHGLNDADVANIISIIEPNEKIEKIILFGSRAKKTFKTGSDIDLALIGTDLQLNDILALSVKMDSLFLPYRFDFVIYDRIEEQSLLDHINRVGVLLFTRQKGFK